MTPPMWEFELTPEQAMKIALVSVNWAMVDNQIGHLIEFLSGITDHKVGAELIHVIDLKRKIDILDSRRKRGAMPPNTDGLVKELVFAGNTYRPDRNMLVHGVPMKSATGPVIWSQAKMKSLDFTDLDDLVSEAHYAAHVTHHLMMACNGVTQSGGPPPRPPERPRRP
jgi:hypothetical protein